MAASHDLRNLRQKFNHPYSEEERALFARYVEQRAACRPAACTNGPQCWVLEGPPALGNSQGPTCLGCRGHPRITD